MGIKSIFLRYGPLLMLALSCFSCTAGTAVRKSGAVLKTDSAAQIAPNSSPDFIGDYSTPEGLRFMPTPLPVEASFLETAFGVGTITRERQDPTAALSSAEKAALTASFQNAYSAGLLRGLPLDGVLGGDHIHSWPIAPPVTWVQNWRSSENYPNSWGIPSLILAVRGIRQEKVFIIHGPILDAYGKSGGVGGANGAAGYGAPRGEEYRWGNGIAQRFDFGLIIIDGSGKSIFLQEDVPSVKEQIPAGVGEIFRSAWINAVDRGFTALPNDGPVYYIDFPPWTLTGGSGASGKSFVLSGLYYQIFDEGKTLFIRGEFPAGFLSGGVGLDPGSIGSVPENVRPGFGSVRVLTGPFLAALMSAHDKPIPGTEALAEDSLPAGFTARIAAQENSAFARTLLRGIAHYGFPLSDAIPQKDDSGKGWKEAQRFTRGWITTN
jgi:hypothetical protein